MWDVAEVVVWDVAWALFRGLVRVLFRMLGDRIGCC